MPRFVDLLVSAYVLAAMLAVWFVLTGFDAITALVPELGDVGKGDYGFSQALVYILYTLPRRAYTLYPTAAVIGALLGLGALATSSELTALRAIGLSRTRICAPVIAIIVVLTGAMVLVAETIGPAGEQYAQRTAIDAKSAGAATSHWSGLWAREGNTFLNAKQGNVVGRGADASVELSGITLYEFAADGRLASIATAEHAVHQGSGWDLEGLRRSEFRQHEVVSSRIEHEHWASSLNPDVLKLGVTKPRYLRLAELHGSLDYLERNQLDQGEFVTAYWARIFYPFSTIILCLAALPFAFGALRSGGFGKRLFVGIVLGVGMFTIQTLTVNMAQVYHMDLRLAYALPPLLLAVASWLHFRRKV